MYKYLPVIGIVIIKTHELQSTNERLYIICEYDLYTSLQNEIANNILLLYIRVYNNIIL